MKKAMLLVVIVLLFSSAFATDLNACKDDNSFASIGNCIVRGTFQDYMLLALVLLAVTAALCFQIRVPIGMALSVGLLMVFAMEGWLGPEYFSLLFNLFLVATGAFVGLAILHFVRR